MYPHAQQGTRDVESMGQSVLAYQFIAGLLSDITLKLAGSEGSFEQLLMRARFEEAKLRDLVDPASKSSRNSAGVPAGGAVQSSRGGSAATRQKETYNNNSDGNRTKPSSGGRCYTCGF